MTSITSSTQSNAINTNPANPKDRVFGSASFQAYTYLELAVPLEEEHEGVTVDFSQRPNMTYSEFQKDIQSNQDVNSNYASSVPQFVNTAFTEMGKLNSPEYSMVAKAYQLGMVNSNTQFLTPTSSQNFES